ncbi:MAG: PAS domain S-box protein [Candidatus Hodarchaeota archaeon]
MNNDDALREIKAFRLIAEAALKPCGSSELYQEVLAGIVDVLGYDLGTFRQFDEETQVLRRIAIVGLEPEQSREEVDLDDKDYLAARVARTRIPIFVPNVAISSEIKDRLPVIQELGIESLIFWPIMGATGELLGVLNIASRSQRGLSERDRGIFETIADMFATVLERHKSIEALEESEEKYRYLAEYSKDVIWTVDMDLTFTYLSPSAIELVGYSPEELVGRRMSDIVAPSSMERVYQEMKKSLELEKTVGRHGYDAPPIELEMIRKDGSTLWVEGSRAFLREEDDTPIGVIGVARDITRRKRAEEELEKAITRAEFYNDLLAHDLANIQQGIMASLELLKSQNLPERQTRFVESALSLTNRGVALTSNAKKLARIAREEADLLKTDIHKPLHESIQMIKDSFPDRTFEIHSDVREEEFFIMADEFFVDVFYNLLHNSTRLDTNTAVLLHIHASPDSKEGLMKLTIEDQGPGIDDDLKEAVFSRLEVKPKQRSGLGLTLVKQIITRYSGDIWVEDRVQGDYRKGTRFVIQLPTAP